MAILDQVRKNQFQEKIAMFNPVDTLNTLFSYLNDKERDVIKRRFGLGMDKKFTLEEIGSHYGITRERIRQIENLTINKLKQIQELKVEMTEAERVIAALLEQFGGVMEEQFFMENILNYLNSHPDSESSLLFLAEHIFSENISKIKQDKEFNHLWKLGSADIALVKEIISEMVSIIEQNQKPVSLKNLLENFKNSNYYEKNKDKVMSAASFLEATDDDINKILESYLRASRKIKQDLFNEWGLVSWGIVQPKKINDKIYITLKKAGKPLHFVDIASMINDNKFDEKIAYPPTVHNELILDQKYVLVGRGIYALKEWGYKPGNVADVVEELLKGSGPMTKDQIIEGVLAKRDVKKSTIYLSLMNNAKIKKLSDGRYAFEDKESLEINS
ncbi:MAG: sigma factor-like helix-turn-helix DNA-binding protein [Candidatus Buchananbacteria bacterium]